MMRDHYVFSSGRLQRKDNTVYYIAEEGARKTLPIEKIRNLHIFGEVDMNTKLLNYLSQYDICIHIYNYYGFYAGTYYPREKNISGFLLVNQAEHYTHKYKRLFLAHQFIAAGIHHMLRNLRKRKKETATSIEAIMAIQPDLQTCTDIPMLMGKEGQIRKMYYEGFQHLIKQDFVFSKRTKQPPNDPINALLSFGNTMMYQTVLSEIYRTALNPTISFLHEPSTKRFSLSLDLAEIYKPLIVDPLILTLINKRTITKKHFENFEGEICYLNEEGKKRFLRAWEERLQTSIMHRKLKRKTTYRYLIRLECYKLIKHFINDEVYKPLKAWW
ncbi:type I-B CRISPR-associated endonuclease Cas1b [Halalkalibacterium halodurans]|uniref:type I-B CRISPR-associated endonuclease Cas1b n=1 Tax=Halalkalibacterium halodurans TaxID=86665 RepID=UPI0010FDC389|nr:type I-B CRISPR-associated endonuclease Cas1b [Halalkalibacterium halodurans]